MIHCLKNFKRNIMTTVEMLTQKEKELVAVAASIASGYVPCTIHYLKSVRQAGGSETEVFRAIRIALDVRDDATEMMAEVAQGNPNYEYPGKAEAGSVQQPIDNLVAMGAAFACNSVAGLEYYWTKAKQAGASTRQMLQVIQSVRAIKREAVDDTNSMLGRLLEPTDGKEENTDKRRECVSSSGCCN
jgi:alkylhydroperoxidase/carboxymuconolactone decarboxylase family protein YurZ